MQGFSFKRVLKSVLATVILIALGAGAYFAVTSRPVKIAYSNLVLDSRQHFFTCEQLPFYPQVEKALAAHADVVEKLKQTGADVKPYMNKCKNWEGGIEFIKGDLEITYNTHKQRLAIEEIIGDNFFGIPYRGYNR